MSDRTRYQPWYRVPGERYEAACDAADHQRNVRMAEESGVSIEAVEAVMRQARRSFDPDYVSTALLRAVLPRYAR